MMSRFRRVLPPAIVLFSGSILCSACDPEPPDSDLSPNAESQTDASASTHPSTETSPGRTPGAQDSRSKDPRMRVSAENICAKLEQKGEDDDQWADWVETMSEEKGECSTSVSALEASFEETYPGFGRRFLGVYDRCIDLSTTPEEYLACVEKRVPMVEERAKQGDAGAHGRRGRGMGGKDGKGGKGGKGGKRGKRGPKADSE